MEIGRATGPFPLPTGPVLSHFVQNIADQKSAEVVNWRMRGVFLLPWCALLIFSQFNRVQDLGGSIRIRFLRPVQYCRYLHTDSAEQVVVVALLLRPLGVVVALRNLLQGSEIRQALVRQEFSALVASWFIARRSALSCGVSGRMTGS